MKRWYLLAAAIAALILWHAWASQFNHDEIEHLHAAWLVAQGERPYVDFLEQHHPILWYALAPAAGRLTSVRSLVFAARLLDLACLGVVLVAFARILRRVYPEARARWPLLLLASSFMFVRNTLEVRPDPLMNALVYCALLSWVAFVQDRRRIRALLAGLLFGAAAAVLQKALVVLALVIASSLLLAVRHRSDRERARRFVGGAALMAAGAIGPILALYAAVAAAGFFSDFWFWNYGFNRFFYLQATLSKHFSVLVTLGISVAEDAVLWLAGIGGMVLCATRMWRRRSSASVLDDARLGLLAVGAGYVPYLCLNRFPLEQYFIVFLPLLALFSAEVFERARSWTPRARAIMQGSAVFMTVALASILVLYPGNAPQRDVQDAILAQTGPDEPVFAPPPYHPVFRRDAGYFWYNGTLIGNAYEEYCRSRDCTRNKQDLDDRRWASHPPRFVYLYDPEYEPIHWSSRAPGYVGTSIPGLLRATSALSSRAAGPGGSAHERNRFLSAP